MMLASNRIYNMDCLEGLKLLDDDSIHCVCTSPPYWSLREYGVDGQIGQEDTPGEYIDRLSEVFAEVYRVLRPDGVCWVVISDTYCGTSSSRTSLSSNGDKSPFSARSVAPPLPNESMIRQGPLLADYFDPKYPKGRTGQKKAKNRKILGIKPKDLCGIPWTLAFRLRSAGWYLRQECIWAKPNPLPESVTDRCVKAHESVFLFAKSRRYYFDHKAIREPAVDARKNGVHKGSAKYQTPMTQDSSVQGLNRGGRPRCQWDDGVALRNKRSVFFVATKPLKDAHYAAFPRTLIEPCILAGCPPDGIVLDPFMGSGTTAMTAAALGRQYIGFEINPAYIAIAEKRIKEGK